MIHLQKLNQRPSPTWVRCNQLIPNSKVRVVRADRHLYRRLLIIPTSWHKVSRSQWNIILCCVPLSLATHDGHLRVYEAKTDLSHILSDQCTLAEIPQTDVPTTVIIDGMALIHNLNRPVSGTFGDFVEKFSSNGYLKTPCTWVDIILDSYRAI